MMRSTRSVLAAVSLATLFAGGAASAAAFPGSGGFAPGGSFIPQVPVSAFARPSSWIDPSRLHVSTSVSMGSGFGRGVNALQVTSLSYAFQAPVWMSVSVGNAWGPDQARSGQSFFLEGLDLGYRPFSNLQIQVHYKDVRSPLQLPPDYRYGFWGR